MAIRMDLICNVATIDTSGTTITLRNQVQPCKRKNTAA